MMMSENTKAQFAETHNNVTAILPWYVNGTLTALQKRDVDAHLGNCLVCRRELAALKNLQTAMRERHEDVACENALAGLHARLDKQELKWRFPWAAAASMVMIVGLVFAASNRVTEGLLDFSDGFQTLGNRPHLIENPINRSARIVFRNDVDATEIVALLDTVDASIDTGPSQRGAYTISFAGTLSSVEQRQALENLRDSGRVLFVEPVVVTLDERKYAR